MPDALREKPGSFVALVAALIGLALLAIPWPLGAIPWPISCNKAATPGSP
jgi:hypothetical protein